MKMALSSSAKLKLLILVAALGYFVDVYDLLLLNVVRKPSLLALGVPAEQTLSVGLHVLNLQVFGLLIGGFLFGVLGDKRGRLSVLFGSIILYSIATLLNGFVTTVGQYELLRFIAGVGLAGELGAGIALITESMSAERRGIGTVIMATGGLLGAVFAAFIGTRIDWRTAYLMGGIMGFCILILRIGAYESGLYLGVRQSAIAKGDLRILFGSGANFLKFLRCTLVGFPFYFIVGILITGAPEFAKAFGIAEPAVPGIAVMYCYIAMTVGDIFCSILSQMLASRKIAITLFHLIALIGIIGYLYVVPRTLQQFYNLCALVGFGAGFWATVLTNAAEQFGTNIRATVATLTPNLIRALLIPISFTFEFLKPSLGIIQAAGIVGVATVLIALISLFFTEERFGKSLDFLED